ncbi:MAG TPA: ATP-binding protein, partial [Kofleriaceae bacterium]
MTASFIEDGGACGELVRAFDWSTTPLGPIESWPASLRSMVACILHTKQPMLLFWGPDLIQFYNDSFVPSFGQGKHPAALGQRARECWADAWPVVGAQLEAVMSRGEPAWYESALVPIHRNGRMEEVFWTYSYSPVYNDSGEIHGTLVVVTEMTGRVLAARRLQALAQLSLALSTVDSYAAAFAAVEKLATQWPADLPFVVLHHSDGHVIRHVGIDASAASRVIELVNASPPVVAKDVALVDGPPSVVWPEPVTTAVAGALGPQHGIVVGTSPRLPLDDDYRSYLAQIFEHLSSTLARIDNDAVVRAVQRQRDNLLMKAPVGTALMTGPNHVFQLANPLYCKIVGRDPVGKAYLDAFPELRGTQIAAVLDRVYATGEPFVVSEFKASLDRDGVIEDCYFTFNLEALRDEHEQIYGMMAVAADITPQVRARHALEKIDADRSELLSALQEANRAKDEFLAMLGHELRNPLAPIVTALELSKARGEKQLAESEREVIDRQVRHVVRLVDDLLDISRITRGALSLDKQHVDLADVVKHAIDGCESFIAHRGHTLAFDGVRGAIVECDEGRLVQIISNLLTNAARYTPPGGTIRVSVTRAANETRVAVSDNGEGIAADVLPRIFETFERGARSGERSDGGLGLGLAIVKNLVAMHGGRVEARSDGPGRGSTFAVYLPLAAEHAITPQAPVVVSPRVTESMRVLVVDDNADAADLLGEIVRMRGH